MREIKVKIQNAKELIVKLSDKISLLYEEFGK